MTRLVYAVPALPVAIVVTWALTAVAGDEGPVTGRERLSYAVLGLCAGAAWPLVLVAGIALYLSGAAHRPASH